MNKTKIIRLWENIKRPHFPIFQESCPETGNIEESAEILAERLVEGLGQK